ncbi:hypothetical protein EDB89DRAFT_283548 [Lactarius sanguifluus]|nr:hypothetical protein EDB89DRAFT_283548 [Lactarius sanguifluus]
MAGLSWLATCHCLPFQPLVNGGPYQHDTGVPACHAESHRREVKQEGRRLCCLIAWFENGVVKVATVVLQREVRFASRRARAVSAGSSAWYRLARRRDTQTCVPGDVQDSSISNPVEVDRPNDLNVQIVDAWK